MVYVKTNTKKIVHDQRTYEKIVVKSKRPEVILISNSKFRQKRSKRSIFLNSDKKFRRSHFLFIDETKRNSSLTAEARRCLTWFNCCICYR